MTYVLMYVDNDGHVAYVQGTVQEINTAMQGLTDVGFDEYGRDFELLGIEDDRLTPLSNVLLSYAPQFTVI